MNHPSLLTLQDDNRRDSAWERAANYEKEERPMRSVSKIVVKGAVDVVFLRAPAAHLVVNSSTTCWTTEDRTMPDKQAPTPLAFYVYQCDECGHRGQLHRPETQQEEHTTCLACDADVVAEWDGGVALEVSTSQLSESLRTTAAEWRTANQDRRGGVVLIWQGAVYGWKNCLRDAAHEQPGAYAVDEAGHIFIAEGGNEYDGAKCWVAVSPTN